MPKILGIEESKIVTKNGVEMQRVIFSNDKIVYVKRDTGDVYPEDTPEKYINLITTYNASHDNIDSTRPKRGDFWEEKNYIKDGSEDRSRQIAKTKNKKTLSKNRETQNAINRMRDLGLILLICGIVQFVVAAIILILAIIPTVPFEIVEIQAILFMITGVLGIVYTLLGSGFRKLTFTPGGMRGAAIVLIILCALDLFTGALGWLGLLVLIYSIVVLVKIGRYEEWYYGEIE